MMYQTIKCMVVISLLTAGVGMYGSFQGMQNPYNGNQNMQNMNVNPQNKPYLNPLGLFKTRVGNFEEQVARLNRDIEHLSQDLLQVIPTWKGKIESLKPSENFFASTAFTNGERKAFFEYKDKLVNLLSSYSTKEGTLLKALQLLDVQTWTFLETVRAVKLLIENQILLYDTGAQNVWMTNLGVGTTFGIDCSPWSCQRVLNLVNPVFELFNTSMSPFMETFGSLRMGVQDFDKIMKFISFNIKFFNDPCSVITDQTKKELCQKFISLTKKALELNDLQHPGSAEQNNNVQVQQGPFDEDDIAMKEVFEK